MQTHEARAQDQAEDRARWAPSEQDDRLSRITFDQEQEAAADRRDRFRDEYEGQDDA